MSWPKGVWRGTRTHTLVCEAGTRIQGKICAFGAYTRRQTYFILAFVPASGPILGDFGIPFIFFWQLWYALTFLPFYIAVLCACLLLASLCFVVIALGNSHVLLPQFFFFFVFTWVGAW
ncbi:hypothetical protein, unlikely [Trypanosoma brucei gambiense DAL972]|uniref:Uncharacterized protein n=1 Tax=Trypanosoma brucei gambiense (strain MHOM/CI/86/DAL972) TaxID=679716 RepID=D0A9Q1_TRYB9|nr:hypothetical protein, unlikely [Trypanosoma brucei gambiense DAL972]CBH18402.1 hypothetical protein, unlikely [Trypanosoma brucei gambiense DAL972]|eukprot:XP_011780666.1 hypothetical protein, unlikely [Trypanosoma brucei gambiense DAL972]